MSAELWTAWAAWVFGIVTVMGAICGMSYWMGCMYQVGKTTADHATRIDERLENLQDGFSTIQSDLKQVMAGQAHLDHRLQLCEKDVRDLRETTR